jgi:LytS/YehU family sensor histidine kinase
MKAPKKIKKRGMIDMFQKKINVSKTIKKQNISYIKIFSLFSAFSNLFNFSLSYLM